MGGKYCGCVGMEEDREEEDTLDEYFLHVLWPDLAGTILEHLVMLALGGDDGLSGGLALCGVEGIRMVHGLLGRRGGRGRERGPFIRRGEGLGRRSG